MRDAAGGAKLRPGRGCKMRQPASGRRRQRQVARYFVPLISPERSSVRDTGRLISSIGVVSVAMGIEFLGGKCRTRFCLLRPNLTPICVRPPTLDPIRPHRCRLAIKSTTSDLPSVRPGSTSRCHRLARRRHHAVRSLSSLANHN